MRGGAGASASEKPTNDTVGRRNRLPHQRQVILRRIKPPGSGGSFRLSLTAKGLLRATARTWRNAGFWWDRLQPVNAHLRAQFFLPLRHGGVSAGRRRPERQGNRRQARARGRDPLVDRKSTRLN